MGDDQTASLRPEEGSIAAIAAAFGLRIPDSCLAGVADNLRLLAEHSVRVTGRTRPDDAT